MTGRDSEPPASDDDADSLANRLDASLSRRFARSLVGQWKSLLPGLFVAVAFVHAHTHPDAAISALPYEVLLAASGLLLFGAAAKWAWEDATTTDVAVPTGPGV